MKITVESLRKALASYKGSAEVKIVDASDKDSEIEYDGTLFDIWVEGENEEKDEFGYRKRNPESNVVSIKIFR